MVLQIALMLLAQAPAATAPKTPAAKPAATKPTAAKPATTTAAPKPATTKPAAAKPAAEAAPPVTPRPDGVYAVFEVVQGATPLGKIVCKLYEKESPITVANFIGLATGTKMWVDPKTRQKVKKPLYDGLVFHRVIPRFMIQGGDPLGSGMGGTDSIPDEFDLGLQFDKPGVLAMANAGPNTGSSQFFITEAPTPHLNMKHTIFGQVIEGQEVVEQIARVPRGESDRPREAVVMKSVRIERWPKPVAAPKPAAAKPKPAAAKPKPAAPAATTPKPTPAKPKPAAPATK